MSGGTTIDVTDPGGGEAQTSSATCLALVIAWSAAEPKRIGQVALLPSGTAAVLGRGEAATPSEAVAFCEQRPGALVAGPPLEGPGISRQQLRIRAREDALVIERIGRCPVFVAGAPVEKTVVVPGDVIHLRGQLVLLCTRRARQIPALRDFPEDAMGPYGDVDAVGILGEGPAAWRLREQIGFAAKAQGHVLVHGPSGTGKELAARAIHAVSTRHAGPWVARNAATFPATLIDAELFGNIKGFPNPGTPERPGIVGQVHGGTMFLDEIGELPVELQSHLLRVLDSRGEYHRLGEASARRSDFRLVAATNRDPAALKHDLAARLTLWVEVPPLRERMEDVPLLVRHILHRIAEESPQLGGRFEDEHGDVRVSAALVEHLLGRPLHANVRELESLLWRAMSTSPGGEIALTDAVLAHSMRAADKSAECASPAPASSATSASPPQPVREPTPDEIRAAVAAHGGNLAQAARALGLSSRYTLYRLLKRHDIEIDDLRS